MIKLNKIYYSSPSTFLKKSSAKNILKNISFDIERGDILGIVGESGAGKTTLAKIIAGIIKAESGTISYQNINQNEIQILFQNSLELINPLRKVNRILEDIKKNNSTILEVVKSVGLNENILTKFGYQLSGGERQRIALARILLINPKLLIIDEPFSAQDKDSQAILIDILNNLNKDGNVTIVVVSHDLMTLSSFANKLIVLKEGKVEEVISEDINTANFKSKYTKFLFQAIGFNLNITDFDKN